MGWYTWESVDKTVAKIVSELAHAKEYAKMMVLDNQRLEHELYELKESYAELTEKYGKIDKVKNSEQTDYAAAFKGINITRCINV